MMTMLFQVTITALSNGREIVEDYHSDQPTASEAIDETTGTFLEDYPEAVISGATATAV
jgi:hypothetical protein